MIKILTTVSVLAIGILLIAIFRKQPDNQTADPDLRFSGVVINVVESKYNGHGIVLMSLLKSNVEKYDPRGSAKKYWCLIKDGYAEVYTHAYSSMIGDTLNFDIANRIMSEGVNRMDEGSIKINSSERYWNFVRDNSFFKGR